MGYEDKNPRPDIKHDIPEFKSLKPKPVLPPGNLNASCLEELLIRC